MDFNYDRLRERIEEVFGSQEHFSTKIGLKSSELKQKLENKAEFTQREINRCCALLSIGGQEISAYFFTEESSENRTYVPKPDNLARLEYGAVSRGEAGGGLSQCFTEQVYHQKTRMTISRKQKLSMKGENTYDHKD